ncbi:UNKNOWN [Stylonychia lemnae]|uniref:Uncharacterized protein n=1 Tax=Stylonychia lemnae TaxID=5949 RepID=A0A078AFN0_STYLE|nr:UNKNOWN [Stylonychia lemnae]|eukprot:CDW81035.1 UNKNOWN [Stylonychia lemnae]
MRQKYPEFIKIHLIVFLRLYLCYDVVIFLIEILDGWHEFEQFQQFQDGQIILLQVILLGKLSKAFSQIGYITGLCFSNIVPIDYPPKEGQTLLPKSSSLDFLLVAPKLYLYELENVEFLL